MTSGAARLVALLCLAQAACTGTPSSPATSSADAEVDAWADVTVGAPNSVVVGQHPSESKDPTEFTVLPEGGKLELIFGHQGLFMVVLGVRSQSWFVGALTVAVELSTPDTSIATYNAKQRRTVHAPDGFDYLWELQVIVDGDVWRGQTATLRVQIDDEDGKRFLDTRTVVIGDPLLPRVCLEPSPQPTRAADTCDTAPGPANRLDPGGPTDAIAVAPGLGKSSLLVAAHRGEQLLLWESTADVNPSVEHHMAPANPDPWIDPKGIVAGPWALAVDGLGPAAVWGSGDGTVRFATPGQPWLSLGEGTPVAALPSPNGFKVLIEGGGAVNIHTYDASGTEVSTHFVVNRALKASGPLSTSVEGELIVVTFPGIEDERPVMFQTASIFGGQCSIPSSLGLTLGEGTVVEAAGLSYGLPVLAVTRPPAAPGCQPSFRVLSKPLSGEGSLDTESAVPWSNGARVVAHGDGEVSTVVGLAPLTDGWQLVAQFTDQPALAPGKVAVGPEVAGDPPPRWDVTWQGRYAAAWAYSGGVWLQRFCFTDHQ